MRRMENSYSCISIQEVTSIKSKNWTAPYTVDDDQIQNDDDEASFELLLQTLVGDDQDAPIPTDQASSIGMHIYNQKESATLDGSANMLGAGPMTVFGGGGGGSGVIQQGMKIPVGFANFYRRLGFAKTATILRLKNELKDSFTPNTYNIRYHGKAIETDLAWKNCVQAFGETGNRCMKLSIHE
ncbi:hypothetical protein Tco_1299425 [Tanacetum coccineum]